MSKDLPQRVRQHVLGKEAVDAVSSCFPTHWITREESPDYGIDLVVEIVKGTAVTGVRFGVQIKGKDSPVEEGQEAVKISGVKKSSVAYWHQRAEPVMIAAYSTATGLVAWRWTDDIDVPSTQETTIAIPIKQNLATVNWNTFTAQLEKRYEQLWKFRRQSLTGITLKETPSPAMPIPEKMVAKNYPECALTIYKEATIIQYGDKVAIIDCGRKAQDEVIQWLEFHRVTKLEFIAISHLHSDHYAGFARILDRVAVQSAFLPPIADPDGLLSRVFTPTPSFIVLLGQLQFFKTNIYFFSSKYQILPLEKGGKNPVVLEICFPLDALARSAPRFKKTGFRMYDHNAICAIFRVSLGRTAFLLPGDATQEVWREVIEHNGERMLSHGILLPHNGNYNSLSLKILKKVIFGGSFPAVYQPERKFKFPQSETLELVRKAGGVLIRADERPIIIEMTLSGLEVL